MFSAMGTQARLRIIRLLLTAQSEGLVVGEIQEKLENRQSTLSHLLDLESGGGLDVLLSARRVGPMGKASALTMTDEMLALAAEQA